MKIVSLVPSLTELLFKLDLADSIVGVTQFCIYPPHAQQKPIVGGTKNPDISLIKQLDPDLIIANKEENRKEDIELLQEDFQVILTHPKTLDDNISLFSQWKGLFNPRVDELLDEFTIQLINARNALSHSWDLSVFCPIWKQPLMTINSDTFIHAMLTEFGLENVAANYPERYPSVVPEDLGAVDLVLLPTEPFHWKEHHIPWLQNLEPFEKSKFMIIDGSYLSWYGYRPIIALPRIEKLLCDLIDQ